MLHLFSLKRWETYCVLAIASVSWLLIVSFWTHHHRSQQQARVAAETLQPVAALSRGNEPAWTARHKAIVAAASSQPYDVLLLGDSITQGWLHQDGVWNSAFPNIKAVNAGITSDRVEHVLWRVKHGLVDRQKPRVVVLMAGINNLAVSSPQHIAGGLQQIVKEIHRRCPDTQILLLGLLPSGESAHHPRRAKIARVNHLLTGLADGYHVHYLDAGNRFLDIDGAFSRSVSSDGIHLTHRGYQIWATVLKPNLLGLLRRMSH